MDDKQLFLAALGLSEPWFISSISFDKDKKRLDIEVDFKRGASFSHPLHAGSFKAYDTVRKSWRHLNFFQHECFLTCRTPRIRLETGEVLQVDPPFAGRSQGFTLLFEALLLQLLQAMPVLQVAEIVGESDDKLWRMLERYVEKARKEEDYSQVEAVGVDETSRRRGHDYITLFVDLKEKKTLFIASGKDMKTFEEFLQDFEAHGGHRKNIHRLSMDMSPAFIGAAKAYLPEAAVTFDRFHLLKFLNRAVDEVRREEVLKEPLLKKARYVLLKNKQNLTKGQKEHRRLLELKGFRLKSFRAMRMREAFQEAYKETGPVEFEEALYSWYWWATHSRIEPMRQVAKTIMAHWKGVLNWIKHKDNNGILEGLNSLIQAAKARARGYRTVKNLKIIAYLLTAKLDFSKVNPCTIT